MSHLLMKPKAQILTGLRLLMPLLLILATPALHADNAPTPPSALTPPTSTSTDSNPVVSTIDSTIDVLTAIPTTVGDLVQPVLGTTFWSKIWEQSSISASVSPLNKSWAWGRMNIPVQIQYQLEDYPAYISNFQQHLDIYSFNFNPAYGISSALGLGTGLTAQITFARLLPSKTDSLEVIPYWISRFPLDSEKLLKNLNPGDMTRLDLTLGVSLGANKAENPNSYLAGVVSAGISRGSELILDVYRMQGSLAHVRILALRHQLEASAGITIDLMNLINHGVGIWNRLLGHLFSIRLFGMTETLTPIRTLPLETYMVDYIFDFSKPDAVTAYDSIMSELHSWSLFSALNFQADSTKIGERLVKFLAKAEEFALRDRNLPEADRAVDRLFKGETNTTYNTFSLISKIRLIITWWDREINSNSSNLNIRGYDNADLPTDLIYLSSTHNDTFNAVQSIWQTLETNTSEALYLATRSSDTGRIVLTPKAPAEVQIIRNLSDKTLKPGQIAKAKAFIDLTLPPDAAKQINWGTLIGGTNKINAFANLKVVVHGSAFAIMKQVTEDELDQLIRSIIIKDPYSDYVAVMNPQTGAYPRETDEALLERMNDDIEAMKQRIRVMIDPNVSQDAKLMAFDQARNQPLFNEVGPAVLVALIPPDQLEQQVYVGLHNGGLNLPTLDSHYGLKDVSPTYSSFQFMISMINNRSFDMRVQLDSEGNFERIDPNNAKNPCPTCDSVNPTASGISAANATVVTPPPAP